MKLGTLLRLGRVSNLPTVLTNVLAGAALARADLTFGGCLVLCVAGALFYVGGMYLNDAFDREIDAQERPERPIPSGEISAQAVFRAGYGMLIAGLAAVAGFSLLTGAGFMPTFLAVVLCGLIVGYNADHKGNPLSPFLMGLCRVFLYLVAGLAMGGELSGALVVGCVALLCYLIGLTFVAKQENLLEFNGAWPLGLLVMPFVYLDAFETWGGTLLYMMLAGWVVYTLRLLRPLVRNVPRAVAQFIAGISIIDAMFVAGQGLPLLAGLCVAGFFATLALQRRVPGT